MRTQIGNLDLEFENGKNQKRILGGCDENSNKFLSDFCFMVICLRCSESRGGQKTFTDFYRENTLYKKLQKITKNYKKLKKTNSSKGISSCLNQKIV